MRTRSDTTATVDAREWAAPRPTGLRRVLPILTWLPALQAELIAPDSGAEGVIVAQGGAFAGCALHVTNGKLTYTHNFLGLRSFVVEADEGIPPGNHQARMELDYDGGGDRLLVQVERRVRDRDRHVAIAPAA